MSTISISEIVKNQLYLGNLSAALNPPPTLGITHTLSICPDFPSSGPNHLTIPVQDTEYDDLLVHLPKACGFIQEAIDEGGRVLVHCVMGVSRSAAVVVAYLMSSTLRTPLLSLQSLQRKRPQAHPNYGFLKQLEAFEECGYAPTPTHPAYRAWKKKQARDVGRYLGTISDVVEVKVDKAEIFFTSEFPNDTFSSSSLLITLGVTHLLTISPSSLSTALSSLSSGVKHEHVNLNTSDRSALLLSLPRIARWIKGVLEEKGVVLVHCLVESRGVAGVVAAIMLMQGLEADEAFAKVDDVLPLFNPTKSFHKTLELFHVTSYNPTLQHPLVRAWLAEEGWDVWSGAYYSTNGFVSGRSSRRGSNESVGSDSTGSGARSEGGSPWGSEESTPWGSDDESPSRVTTPDLEEKPMDVDAVQVEEVKEVSVLQWGLSAPVTTRYNFQPKQNKNNGVSDIMSPSLAQTKTRGYFCPSHQLKPSPLSQCKNLARQLLEDTDIDMSSFGEALSKIGAGMPKENTKKVASAVQGMRMSRWESAGTGGASALKAALVNSALRDGREGRRQER